MYNTKGYNIRNFWLTTALPYFAFTFVKEWPNFASAGINGSLASAFSTAAIVMGFLAIWKHVIF